MIKTLSRGVNKNKKITSNTPAFHLRKKERKKKNYYTYALPPSTTKITKQINLNKYFEKKPQKKY